MINEFFSTLVLPVIEKSSGCGKNLMFYSISYRNLLTNLCTGFAAVSIEDKVLSLATKKKDGLFFLDIALI